MVLRDPLNSAPFSLSNSPPRTSNPVASELKNPALDLNDEMELSALVNSASPPHDDGTYHNLSTHEDPPDLIYAYPEGFRLLAEAASMAAQPAYPLPTHALALTQKILSNEQVTDDDLMLLLEHDNNWAGAVCVATCDCPDDRLALFVFNLYTLDERFGDLELRALAVARRFTVIIQVAQDLLGRDPWSGLDLGHREFPWFEGAWDLIGDNLDLRCVLVAAQSAYSRPISFSGDISFKGRVVSSIGAAAAAVAAAPANLELIQGQLDVDFMTLYMSPIGMQGCFPLDDVGGFVAARLVATTSARLSVSAATLNQASKQNNTPLGPHSHPVTQHSGCYYIDTGKKFDTSGAFSIELLVLPTDLHACTLVSAQGLALALETSNRSFILTLAMAGQTRLVSPEPVPSAQWSHVCALATANSLMLLLNGIVVASAQRLEASPVQSPQSVWLGARPDQPGGLHGSLAEVRLWPFCLDAAAVTLRRARGLNAAELKQVAGYWPLDQQPSCPLGFLREQGTAKASKRSHGVLKWIEAGAAPSAEPVGLAAALAPSACIPLTGLALDQGPDACTVDLVRGEEGWWFTASEGGFVWLHPRLKLSPAGLDLQVDLRGGAGRVAVLVHACSALERPRAFEMHISGLEAVPRQAALVVVEVREQGSRMDVIACFCGAKGAARIGGVVRDVAAQLAGGSWSLLLSFAQEGLVAISLRQQNVPDRLVAVLACELGGAEHVGLGLGLVGALKLMDWVASTVQPPPVAEDAAPPMTWNCPQCAAVNPASAVRCPGCGGSRLPQTLLAGILQPKAPPPAAATWTCPKCTYSNEPDVRFCSICNEERASPEAASWACPQCTLLNSPGATKCTACDHAAPVATQSSTQQQHAPPIKLPVLPPDRARSPPPRPEQWESTLGLFSASDRAASEEFCYLLEPAGVARFDGEEVWRVEWHQRGRRFAGALNRQGTVMSGQWFLGNNAMGAFRADLVTDNKEIGSQLPCGLANMQPGLQNVCYQNAIVQALFATSELLTQVLKQPTETEHANFGIVQRLFAQMLVSRRPCLRGTELQRLLRADHVAGEQMDASDFCHHLFSVLEEQVPTLPFGVQVSATNKCVECGTEKTSTQKELGLAVALPNLFFPITDLCIVSCPSDDLSQLPSLPPGYERIRVDLNPRQAKAFFLCFCRNARDAPITELHVAHRKAHEAPGPPGQFRLVTLLNKEWAGGACNVNEGGQGRDQVFLFFKKDSGSPITEIRFDNPESGFRRINVDLNVGGGESIFLSYRRGMPLTDCVVGARAAQAGRHMVQLERPLMKAAKSPGAAWNEDLFVFVSDAGDRTPLTGLFLLPRADAADAVRQSGGALELCGDVVLPDDKVLVKERGNGSPIAALRFVTGAPQRDAGETLDLGPGDDDAWLAADGDLPLPLQAGRLSLRLGEPGMAIRVGGTTSAGGLFEGLVFGLATAAWELLGTLTEFDGRVAIVRGQLDDAGDFKVRISEEAPVLRRTEAQGRKKATQRSSRPVVALEPVSPSAAGGGDGEEFVLGSDGQPFCFAGGCLLRIARGDEGLPLKQLAEQAAGREVLPGVCAVLCAEHDTVCLVDVQVGSSVAPAGWTTSSCVVGPEMWLQTRSGHRVPPSFVDGQYTSSSPLLMGLDLRAVAEPEECRALVLEGDVRSYLSGVLLKQGGWCEWAFDATAPLQAAYCVVRLEGSTMKIEWARGLSEGCATFVRDERLVLSVHREPAELWERGALVFTNRARGLDVQGLVDQHFGAQSLDGDERLVCESAQCQGQRRVHVQRTTLEKEPSHLLLTIKRMSFDKRLQRSVKNLANTRFEPKLKLNSVVYELYACVVHEGFSASSGHYVCYALHKERWLLFNDAKVTPLTGFDDMLQSIDKSANRCAYLLFYRKQGDGDVGLRAVGVPEWVEALRKSEVVDFVQGDLEKRTSRAFFLGMLRRVVVGA